MTEPYYQDDHVTLYQGEALAVLADLPTASVGAVISDPPYSSGGMVRSDRTGSTGSKYVQTSTKRELADFSGDSRDGRAYGYWSALWLSEAMRATEPGGVCAIFTDWRQLPATTDALQAGGWVWRGVIPWHKPNGRMIRGQFANPCEYVVWGTNGARDPLSLAGWSPKEALPGFYQFHSPREREHQTQKPVDLMRALLRIAPPGAVILDPFMGSGTTGVAAMIEGRKFIGAEMTPTFAEVAERRIREAQGQAVDRGDQSPLDFGATA